MKLIFAVAGVAALVLLAVPPASGATGHTVETDSTATATTSPRTAEPTTADTLPQLSERGGFLLSLLPTVAGATLPPLFWGIALASSPTVSESAIYFGIGFMATGLSLGPGLGHMYARRIGYGFIGFGGRALGYAAASFLFIVGLSCTIPTDDDESTACKVPGRFALAGAFIVSAGILAWTIYDIATVKRAVRKENSRRQSISVRAFPSIMRTADQKYIPALSVTATF